jgi:hypothetical protein
MSIEKYRKILTRGSFLKLKRKIKEGYKITNKEIENEKNDFNKEQIYIKVKYKNGKIINDDFIYLYNNENCKWICTFDTEIVYIIYLYK